MSALSREIGSRGRADAVIATPEVAHADSPEPSPQPADSAGAAALRSELETLRLKELRARAKAEGAEPEQLEDAADADDPKQAVIDLLLGMHAATFDSGSTERPSHTNTLKVLTKLSAYRCAARRARRSAAEGAAAACARAGCEPGGDGGCGGQRRTQGRHGGAASAQGPGLTWRDCGAE